MSLRIVQIVLPASKREELAEALAEIEHHRWWTAELRENFQLTHVVTRADQCEAMLDELSERFSGAERFRVTLLAAEATRPKLSEPEKPERTESSDLIEVEADPDGALVVDPEPRAIKPLIGRVSREELEEDLVHGGAITRLFIAMTVLATVVACVGLVKDSPAIVIGAMVIAPLLGPNMALALGTTLADGRLIRRALRANGAGIGVALVMSVVFGALVRADTQGAELAARASVDSFDIALALAAGAAGSIAATTGAASTLVGVMVAVALLPPTAACGMLLGVGAWREAFGAFQMLLINVVGINLAATGVFWLQGVRPSAWWAAGRARSASVRAVIVWTGLLGALAALIWLT